MKIEEMDIEELLQEIELQRKIESDARSKASDCEVLAVRKFQEKHNLLGTVVHKETGKKGVLRAKRVELSGRYQVDFYPLKKNGEESKNRDIYLSVWYGSDLKKNFERLLEAYSSVE